VKDSFVLVDMPGFGYAKVSKQERHVWKSLNEEYLVKRDKLTLVCYLVDSRHDPQPIDLASIELLENLQRRYVVILTKKDKISTKLTEERVEQLRSLTQFCSHCADILPYSVVQSDTRANLWAIIKREISK
jgi:GTP-binding protein